MSERQNHFAEYVRSGSESAFAGVVHDYLDLVYSTALRLVEGDAHRAQDVAQTVFLDLARMARRLSPEVMLGGWLHRHTCFVAANAMRSERRRHLREQQAVEMNALENHSPNSWSALRPVLDEAIDELAEPDRSAIVARFFDRRDFRAVGEALGINEDAARMRVNRALEKLEGLLRRRGVTSTAGALSVVLSGPLIQAAPAGLALSISSAAASAAGGAASLGFLNHLIAMTAVQKTFMAVALIAVVGTGLYQARQISGFREQVRSLEVQRAPLGAEIDRLRRERDDALARLNASAAPEGSAPSIAAAPAAPLPRRPYDRFKEGQTKLTRQQAEAYLDANGRTSGTLLAAYRTTGDSALLLEAMQTFPNDPQVAFEALFRTNAPPADRRVWLDSFKKSAPENGLADYLSALDYFQSGQTNRAIQELTAARGKAFQDYSAERYQDDAEAFLAAGYSVAEAKTISGLQLLLPQLAQVKDLGHAIVDLSQTYRKAGDDSSAQAALQTAVELAQRYSIPYPGEPSISQLVGLHLEALALKEMEPSSPYGSGGETVRDQLDALARQRQQLEEQNRQAESIFPKMEDQDWINYRDRWLMFGEQNAIEWLIEKYVPE